MTITFKGKLRASGPLNPDIPKNLCPVRLVEGIPHINEEEPPVLLLGIMCPYEGYIIDTTLNYCF